MELFVITDPESGLSCTVRNPLVLFDMIEEGDEYFISKETMTEEQFEALNELEGF